MGGGPQAGIHADGLNLLMNLAGEKRVNLRTLTQAP